MEVRSASAALMNKAAAIDNSGSDDKKKQQSGKVQTAAASDKTELDDESVMLSISAAGLRRSLLLEKQAAKGETEEEFSGENELESMMKKMEGLSSQVINGHFSSSDRLNFNAEIGKLTNELNRLNGGKLSVTKDDCYQLSQRISDLTRIINDAAVYRKSAQTIFMVNSKQSNDSVNTSLDIAI